MPDMTGMIFLQLSLRVLLNNQHAASRLIYGTLSKVVNKVMELIHFSYVSLRDKLLIFLKSDSIKLGDKLIPVFGTFEFVDW